MSTSASLSGDGAGVEVTGVSIFDPGRVQLVSDVTTALAKHGDRFELTTQGTGWRITDTRPTFWVSETVVSKLLDPHVKNGRLAVFQERAKAWSPDTDRPSVELAFSQNALREGPASEAGWLRFASKAKPIFSSDEVEAWGNETCAQLEDSGGNFVLGTTDKNWNCVFSVPDVLTSASIGERFHGDWAYIDLSNNGTLQRLAKTLEPREGPASTE